MEEKCNQYSVCTVYLNKHLQSDYYLLGIDIPQMSVRPQPGQFYQVKPLTVGISNLYTGSLLFKPLSVFDFEEGRVMFMIKAVGKGTEQIAKMVKGDQVVLIGPLGKGFNFDINRSQEYSRTKSNATQSILVSGGIGYAPLFYLKKELEKKGFNSLWLHGGRSSNDIFPADIICTDDGSQGNKGFITKLIPSVIEDCDRESISQIYCCGPKSMMRVVAGLMVHYNLPSQFSLEEYMACGIGVCMGCAVKAADVGESNTPSQKRYLMVCKDGPVFNREEIDWNE